MERLTYNDAVELGFEYEPIYASSNAITGTHYITKLWVISGNGKYSLGHFDGKLDEEEIKIRFKEIVGEGQQRQYGQQNTVLRKELKPRRERGEVGNASQRLAHKYF